MASTRRNRAPVNQAALAGGGDQTDENPRPAKFSGVPRITRLLALALRFESLLRTGVVKDYAELARLGQVSRARITQIMNLVNLAPDIQEQILWLPRPAGRGGVRETTVRKLSSVVLWSEQRHQWKKISPTTNGTHLPGDG